MMNENILELLPSILDKDEVIYLSEDFPGHYNDYKMISSDDLKSKKVFLFCKNTSANVNIKLGKYFDSSNPSYIFIGNSGGSVISLNLTGGNNFIWIGDNTKFTNLKGNFTVNRDAYFIVGKGVSSWDLKVNIAAPGCIIGDDVMFGHFVQIRTHSGHGFLDIKTGEFNTLSKKLIIEPHVWVGEHVKIFGCELIGACSVLGYDSLITRSVGRCSIAKGHPAISTVTRDKVWSRSQKKRDLDKALYFYNKFYE